MHSWNPSPSKRVPCPQGDAQARSEIQPRDRRGGSGPICRRAATTPTSTLTRVNDGRTARSSYTARALSGQKVTSVRPTPFVSTVEI